MPDSSPIFPDSSGSAPVGSFMQGILDRVREGGAPSFVVENDQCSIAPPQLPPDSLLHGYRLKRCLGQGGFGVTYLAKEELLNRRVVIKENFPHAICEREAETLDVRLKDASQEPAWRWALGNFLREVRLLASIDHPHIVKVYSYFEAHGTAYYVTQYVDGKCLADVAQDYSRRHQPLPQDALYALMVRVLDALDYLHGRQLLHRDIKPDNILVTRLGNPMLIDFGAAREACGDSVAGVVESMGYSPPEQGGQSGDMGPWTDLYAFGATLYFILTGMAPAAGRQRLLYDTLEPLSCNDCLCARYNRKLLASIDKSLAPLIENRYRCVAEWMADLRG